MIIALPPSDGGAVNDTVASVSPGVAVPMTGAAGTVAMGVMMLDGSESGPVPAEFVAFTLKV